MRRRVWIVFYVCFVGVCGEIRYYLVVGECGGGWEDWVRMVVEVLRKVRCSRGGDGFWEYRVGGGECDLDRESVYVRGGVEGIRRFRVMSVWISVFEELK